MDVRDKRKAERNNHDSVIELFDEKGKFFSSVRLTDFSDLGASFSIAEPVTIPAKFRASLRLLSKGVLEAGTQVVRTRKEKNTTHYAVKFSSVKRIYPTGELKDTWQ